LAFPSIKTLTLLSFGAVCTSLFLFLNLWSPQFIEENVESTFLDYRFQVRNLIAPPAVPGHILIVEVDEKSLERHGRWPWNRKLQARLINRIMNSGPAALGVDIFYPEPENENADAALRDALISSEGSIVLAAGFDVGPETDEDVPDHVFDNALISIKDRSSMEDVVTVTKRKLSILSLSENAPLGHVYSPADMDGKLRWECLYIQYENELFPSFPLMVLAHALEMDVTGLTVHGGQGVQLGDTFIPSNRSGRMRINYLGPERTFHYISAADVLGSQVAPSVFQDKIVILGTSAISTFDFVVTPFSARMPGVEKNATVVANLLEQDFIHDIPASIASMIILITGLALTVLFTRFRATRVIVTATLLMLAFVAVNQYLFTYQGLYLNFVYPFFNLILIVGFSGAFKYLTEERSAREMKAMFSRYVSPKIVNQLIANPELAKLGGYRKEVTVLFSDVRDFTTFSERRQPEEVVAHLNDYLHEMTNIIFRWDGTLDKFVGDEIMAFWGAPLDQPNHAELAIKCALNMSDRLDQLQKKWREEGKEPLDIGIGLNTGSVLIGNIGSADKKMDYTIIGDHVNLGARVETLTRKFDSRVLMTEFTMSKIEHLVKEGKLYLVDMKEIDTVKVKGKEIPVKIFGISSHSASQK
jgi:adenylate cyclase